ncbi:peptidoglycan-binding domain-containing protein [Bacillus toyonensis]|uniref:peptidoglycan-binding domain-containing protein n=1 Tax=Bacillus toyonensis TaxID=155322 RepID=UPI002FFF07D4
MEQCFIPSDAVENSRILSVYGEFVELIIRSDYCVERNPCQPFNPKSPSPTTDFFDVDSGVHRCTALNDFLRQHNPSVGQTIKAQCLLEKKGFRFPVPDIITHEPPLRIEYYEIKPNSSSGKRDGRNKMNWFDVICNDYGLPYVRGDQYSPNGKVLVWDGTWLGSPVKVYLRWYLEERGLLVYELCIEVSERTLQEVIAKALIKLAVLSAILILKNPAAAVGAGAAAAKLLLSNVGSSLQDSVGTNGTNQISDVRYVQAMLNDWRGYNGFSLIELTGTFDEETRGAIIDFQKTVTEPMDELIDVNGPAIRALEEAHLVNFLEAMIDFQSIIGNYEVDTENIGYDFHGWPGEDEEWTGGEEEPDPELDLDLLAEVGLRDYLEYLYVSV